MFKHSIKVPRNYKLAATITKKVVTEGGNLKSLLYDDKLKHFRVDVIFALIVETIKRNVQLTELFKLTDLFEKEPRLDPWLAKVLTVELLFGKKKLPGQSKPETTITSYKDKFAECIETISVDEGDKEESEPVLKPRYIRVNTNTLTTSDAIRQFQEDEYKYVRCTSGSYDDYLKQVKNLGEYEFMQDYHVKTVFVFPPKTHLQNHPFVLERKVVLQDKATTLAVHLLAPPPGSVVIDMCAAPGMKTTHLAAVMKNQGKVIAVEQSEERFKTLEMFIRDTGSTCVEAVLSDVLKIRKGQYPDVEYVLLDPSCTGSGMDRVLHTTVNESRIAKISSLQEKLLRHAMFAFPKAKRIVYSTCSIYPEENERVVSNAVNSVNARVKWRVQNCKELLKDQWNNFGSGVYGSMGVRCMYARSDSDFTIGFFLAVLERDFTKHVDKNEDDEEAVNKESKGNSDETVVKNKKNKIQRQDKEREKVKEEEKPEDTLGENTNETRSKKKKNRKQAEVQEAQEELSEVNQNIDEPNYRSKGKKSKKRKPELNEEVREDPHSELKQNISEVNTVSIEQESGENIDKTSIKIKKNKSKRPKTEFNDVVQEGQHSEIIQNTSEVNTVSMECNDENNDETNIKNKKKKSKKRKAERNEKVQELEYCERNQNTSEVNTVSTQQEIDGTNRKIKKKKSKKRNAAENEEAREKKHFERNQNSDENKPGIRKNKKKQKVSAEVQETDTLGESSVVEPQAGDAESLSTLKKTKRNYQNESIAATPSKKKKEK